MYKDQSFSGKANNRLRFKTPEHSVHNISSYAGSWIKTNYEKLANPSKVSLSDSFLRLPQWGLNSIQQVDPYV